MFADQVAGKAAIPANIRSSVYQAVAIDAQGKELDQFLTLFKSTDQNEEKSRLLTAISNVRNETLANRVIEFSFSKDARGKDPLLVLTAMSESKSVREIAWNFMSSSIERITSRFQGTMIKNFVSNNCITTSSSCLIL
jgi:aminopeptidase N